MRKKKLKSYLITYVKINCRQNPNFKGEKNLKILDKDLFWKYYYSWEELYNHDTKPRSYIGKKDVRLHAN